MKILLLYLTVLFVGQAGAVGIGLLFDRMSNVAGVVAFIPIYFAMFWVAWRVVLFFLDKPTAEAAAPNSNSPTTAAMWLLAPASLALCD